MCPKLNESSPLSDILGDFLCISTNCSQKFYIGSLRPNESHTAEMLLLKMMVKAQSRLLGVVVVVVGE